MSRELKLIMSLEVPGRAKYLRSIWSEYSRMHSHLLTLGLFADALGFENLFMNAWKLREHILDDMEATTGGRVIQGACKVGGVRRDISNEKLGQMVDGLNELEKEIRDFVHVFLHDSTIRSRLHGIGVLPKKNAYEYGAVGPTLRGSGWSIDMRELGYAAYRDLRFEPTVETGGDCYARTAVRAKELLVSIDLIRQAVDKIPDGSVDMKVTGAPDGEYFTRVEQPRGELVHYVKGNGTKNLVRSRVRTPTFTNIPPLIVMLKGCELADVPVIVHSIDPCIGCSER